MKRTLEIDFKHKESDVFKALGITEKIRDKQAQVIYKLYTKNNGTVSEMVETLIKDNKVPDGFLAYLIGLACLNISITLWLGKQASKKGKTPIDDVGKIIKAEIKKIEKLKPAAKPKVTKAKKPVKKNG